MARTELKLIPTQFKHLRFVDVEEEKILNSGGYSLAYRCLFTPATGPDSEARVEVAYAFSECRVEENFEKETGRRITYSRLQHEANDFTERFDITDQLPEGWQERLIRLNDDGTIVDIPHSDFDLGRAVIMQFLNDFSDVLFVGEEEGEGSLLENLVTYGEDRLAIDSSVITYTPPTMQDVAVQVAGAVIELADSAIERLLALNIGGVENGPETIAQAIKELNSIKELNAAISEAASSDEDEDEDEDGSDIDDEDDEYDADDSDEEENESDDDSEDDDEDSEDDEDEESDDEDSDKKAN